jgi:hypothetical protein
LDGIIEDDVLVTILVDSGLAGGLSFGLEFKILFAESGDPEGLSGLDSLELILSYLRPFDLFL